VSETVREDLPDGGVLTSSYTLTVEVLIKQLPPKGTAMSLLSVAPPPKGRHKKASTIQIDHKGELVLPALAPSRNAEVPEESADRRSFVVQSDGLSFGITVYGEEAVKELQGRIFPFLEEAGCSSWNVNSRVEDVHIAHAHRSIVTDREAKMSSLWDHECDIELSRTLFVRIEFGLGLPEMRNAMQISVEVPGGPSAGTATLTLTVKNWKIDGISADSVEELKAKIHSKEGYPLEKQRLLFQGTVLEDGKSLEDYGIESGATIRVDQAILTGEAAPSPTPAPGSPVFGKETGTPKEVLESLRGVFEGADSNGDGSLQPAELAAALKEYYKKVQVSRPLKQLTSDVEGLMDQFDDNKNGTLQVSDPCLP